ncbi:amidohydrolase family protein [Dactylosporangium sp. NPDC048998]|uniref:amidohydrolase family protein n=1 Tax=Dactylosporangium sp. NPDC048998 TaxID=3363976 RepID=UPI00371E9907
MTIVDFHHHAPLASYVSRLTALGIQAQPGAPFPTWEPADSVRVMDRLGIDLAVLSVASPGFYFGDQAFTTSLCQDTNDELTEVVRDGNGRFAAVACLPLPSVDAALAEVERVFDRPEFVGVGLLTSYAGSYVGHPRFDGLLEALNDRGALVHVHPVLPAWWPEGEIPIRPSVLEYLFDSTRLITNLLLTEVPRRFPRVRWIFSHCGGAMPAVAPRMVLAEGMPELATVAPQGVLRALAAFSYDTALSHTAADLGALLSFIDDSRVVLGTDFPFSSADEVAERFALLREFLGDTHRSAVLSANARELLGGRRTVD